MERFESMKARHSVRQYQDRPIEQEKRAALDQLAARLNQEHGLHIQVIYEEPKCFASLRARYGKFSGVQNYIALVGQKSPKLEELLGRCGEQLVLEAQDLGLNTCWVALTRGKSRAEVRAGEKQVCLIALGYGAVQGEPHKNKPLEKVCKVPGAMLPPWFRQGMEAALLAPTAMNQQKFCFELCEDGTVRATAGRGFYTKVDLGIAACHFELVTGKTVTTQ